MTQTVNLQLASHHNPFARRMADDGQALLRERLTTLQLNLGKMCNLACHHCHVEAGPNRTEIMTWPTMQSILRWLDRFRGSSTGKLAIATVDLTGGSPEMNPHFRQLVGELRSRGLHLLDRCNPTILNEPGYDDLPQFLADNQVEIVASLPCYLEDNVDKQRGSGVFKSSIIALKKLNQLGYGMPGTALTLDLVYNPVGYVLPPAQDELEQAYKQHLAEQFDIHFNKLWTITNMPIKRFEHALRRDGQYDAYMDRLLAAHNQVNVESVMCRSLISIGWAGSVYDCDFNQMLQMPVEGPQLAEEHVVERESRKLWDCTPEELLGVHIRTGVHCFGCTAGAGSSCTGALG